VEYIQKAMWRLFEAVSQRGPMGPHTDWPSAYPWILGLFALLAVAVLAFTLFPRLERVRATEDIHPEIERLEEGRPLEAEDGSGGALEVAMRLLEPDERRVVEALVAAGGSMLQKDITYELGFSRVKTHRTMVKLLQRGVVTAEKEYNTNRIELADWLREG
jgi:uncharacterized membrane protein